MTATHATTSRLGPVLAATDFSAPARQAADRAALVAHETGAALTLMHVLPDDALQLREGRADVLFSTALQA